MNAQEIASLKRAMPRFAPRTILDVGANAGDVAAALLAAFPEAHLHAFEPASDTHARLRSRLGGEPRATLNRMALDRRPGRQSLTQGRNRSNHLVVAGSQDAATAVETVEVGTGDAYCAAAGIEAVDLLKIDTEGHDLDVLAGFSGLLAAGAIEFVQVETTTTLDNRFHVHLERFIHFLHPFNLRLFRLSDYNRRVHRTKQALNGIWFCNALFVREVESPRLRRDGRN